MKDTVRKQFIKEVGVGSFEHGLNWNSSNALYHMTTKAKLIRKRKHTDNVVLSKNVIGVRCRYRLRISFVDKTLRFIVLIIITYNSITNN